MTNKKIGTLKSTMQFRNINEKMIPYQNGIPYPSFEPQERLVFSLEGIWKKRRFHSDHDWTMMERNSEWISETEENSNGVTEEVYDDSDWDNHQIPLPENKLTGKEEVNAAETYENGVWYRKKFVLDDAWASKTITLKCLGLSYVGDFWINGKYIGFHEGGYTPFSFDVSSTIRSGENTIAVRVDNPPWTSRDDIIPAVNNDFFNYTGIIQDIFLEATDGVHIVRVDVVPKNITGEVDISIIVENRTNEIRTVKPICEIYETDYSSNDWLKDPNAKSIRSKRANVTGIENNFVQLEPSETKVIEMKLFIDDAKIWSIREPNLYVFETLLYENDQQIDSFYTQFGIRTITTDQSNICLNGEPIFLAGVARHEEWPNYGRTASWDRIKSDFLTIEKLHVNMVRTGHYPNHIYTFIMLDRLGLTAMSEIPLWQFETHHYEIQEKRQISYQMWREMVFSNYNRPSIIMWSTQNESKDVQLRKRYNENLVNEVRDLYNDHRLITQSAAADQPGYHDESMEPLDVAGWTMYFGVFHGSTPYEGTRKFIEDAHEKWPNKPILNTEYGLWSNADKSFIDKQVQAYKQVHEALIEKATVTPEGIKNKNGFIAGIDYWTVFDWYVNHNQFYQTMGMYHMDRTTTKPLYDVFINDHKRLMEQTNGIGKYEKDHLEQPISIKEITTKPGQTVVQFENEVDLRDSNYLILKIFDAESSDGFSIELIHQNGKKVAYESYMIEKNKEFDLMIPLWKFDETVISDLSAINLLHDDGRALKIIEIVQALGGR